MEVILLENIRHLGQLGHVVKVKSGFGRNFLIPQGKALRATNANKADFEARRAAFEAKAVEILAAAKTRSEQLGGKTITLAVNASEEGKLFGSVGTREIAHAITEAGVIVEKSEVRLPEGALRYIGEYEISIHLHNEVDSTVKLVIVAA